MHRTTCFCSGGAKYVMQHNDKGSDQKELARNIMKQICFRKIVIATSTFACAALLSLGWSEQRGVSLSIDSAQARVGHPLTPGSAAGVARRHTRRAAVGAAAIGTAAAAGASSYAYYRGPGVWGPDYATRNGMICTPGTWVKLDDGRMHPCQ